MGKKDCVSFHMKSNSQEKKHLKTCMLNYEVIFVFDLSPPLKNFKSPWALAITIILCSPVKDPRMTFNNYLTVFNNTKYSINI